MSNVKSGTRIQWIELNAKPVFFVDLSKASVGEALAIIKDFEVQLQGRAPASVLLLGNVTDLEYDSSAARQWKEAFLRHDVVIRASAVYGASGLVGATVRGFAEARRLLGLSSASSPRIFADAEAAKAWLGKQ